MTCCSWPSSARSIRILTASDLFLSIAVGGSRTNFCRLVMRTTRAQLQPRFVLARLVTGAGGKQRASRRLAAASQSGEQGLDGAVALCNLPELELIEFWRSTNSCSARQLPFSAAAILSTDEGAEQGW